MRGVIVTLFLSGLCFSIATVDGNTQIMNFAQAKKYVFEVASPENRTFYCNCRFEDKNNIDFKSCGYVPLNDNARARRVEVEHIVPAENFGRSFVEWREGHADCVRTNGVSYKGRRCAGKVNETYRRMEADLYNLTPAVGELNARRSNYRYGIIEGEERRFGACDFEVEDRVVEPRPEIRGDIARVYFYMDAAYPGRGVLGNKSRKLFEAWAAEDGVDAAECERARRIEHIQGNANPFVKESCATIELQEAEEE